MILVIGYGNDLRSDDGAGRRVAERVGARSLPGVRALSVHQLTPELAVPLAEAQLAIFVDASVAPMEEGVRVARVEPAGEPAGAHASDPRTLLALARVLYGQCPPAWFVTIPAVCFDIGERLSPPVRRGVREAVQVIRRLIDEAE